MSEQSSSTNVQATDNETAQVENGQVEETEEPEYSNLTPYAASKVAQSVLGSKFGKQTEQTYYGYARSGRIASNYQEWLAKGGKKSGFKVELEGPAFMQYLRDVASGKIKPSTRTDYDALAEEFALDAE
jgi:hypothetical protein